MCGNSKFTANAFAISYISLLNTWHTQFGCGVHTMPRSTHKAKALWESQPSVSRSPLAVWTPSYTNIYIYKSIYIYIYRSIYIYICTRIVVVIKIRWLAKSKSRLVLSINGRNSFKNTSHLFSLFVSLCKFVVVALYTLMRFE